MEEPTPTADAPSKPPLRFRRTRIALSVFFGGLSLLLCVLWVRSYWYGVRLEKETPSERRCISVASIGGDVTLALKTEVIQIVPRPGWQYVSFPIEYELEPERWYVIRLIGDYRTTAVQIPHWVLVVSCVAISLCCWISFPRFSLRTMLIATTLVAVLLGLGVWLAR